MKIVKPIVIDISGCSVAQVMKFIGEALNSFVMIEGRTEYLVPTGNPTSTDYIWVNIPTKYTPDFVGNFFCFAQTNTFGDFPTVKLQELVAIEVNGKYWVDFKKLFGER